ncbi:MAG: adenosine kinase [Candidatus Methylacidiphilales bacterium]
MNHKKYDLIGVGAPILDTLVRVEEAFLKQHVSGQKGGMELVDNEQLQGLVSVLPTCSTDSPGGSAGNTTFALARLGFRTAFIGKMGNDEAAQIFKSSYQQMGGDTSLLKQADAPNARCLSLITPDSQRTMRTLLGASALLSPEEISVCDFQDTAHVHVEGYLLFNPPLIIKILESARQAGCTISLDLASFEVVAAAGDRLPGLLEEYVDIVFANEDEAAACFPGEKDADLQAAAFTPWCRIAAVKIGSQGSWIATPESVLRVPSVPVESPLDTTAAGDLWAAGFLCGWLKNLPLDTCGRFGSKLGAEVVQVLGAALPEERWQAVLRDFSDSR